MSSDPNSPVVLTSVRTDIEAEAAVIALAEYDIRAKTTGGYTAGFRAEAPGDVNVIVRQADLERAKIALLQIQQETGTDWSQLDVGEPEE